MLSQSPRKPGREKSLKYQKYQGETNSDAETQSIRQKFPQWFSQKTINTTANVLCYTKPGDDPSNWKIVLPNELIRPTVEWYHQVTGHPGQKRLYDHIRQRYYNCNIRRFIDNFNCDYCQRHKLEGKGYGLLPEREVRSIPFEECAVDLIGPWEVTVNGEEHSFRALTVIDTVTNLVEMTRIESKESAHVAQKFAQCWLARYPWPQRCIHDPGGEFTGSPFQMLLEQCRIKDAGTSAKNPQANSICERMHQTVGNVLRTLIHGDHVNDINTAQSFVDEALSIAMHAMRVGLHSTLGSSPGSLVFNRDMFLNIPLIADWHAITQRREHLINENLLRENQRRRRHDYAPDQLILKKKWRPSKLGERTSGPYKILQAHTNGTVTIELKEGITERLNIRRIIPFKE